MPRFGRYLSAFVVLAMLLASWAAQAAVTGGDHGSRVEASSGDIVHTLSATTGTETPCIGRRDTNGGGDGLNDAWYLHFGAAGCADTTVNQGTGRSFRLTTDTGTSSMAWVALGSTDSGLPFTGALAAWPGANTCYLEADGIPGFTPGDPAYWDTDAGGSLTQGDIRLVTVSGAVTTSAGTIVRTTDTDFTASAPRSAPPTLAEPDPTRAPVDRTLTCGGFTVQLFRSRGIGQISDLDTVVLKGPTTPAGSANYILLGDVIQAGGLGTSGSKATTSSTFAKRFLTRWTSAVAADPITIVRTTPVPATPADQRLFFHFRDADGTESHVLQNDVTLKTGTGAAAGSPGTHVTTLAGGSGEAIDGVGVAIDPNVVYLDIDNTAGYSLGDPVYFLRPAAIGGAAARNCATCIAVNDVRLATSTNGGSFTAGSLVASGDSDLSNFGTTAGVAGFVVKVYDADQQRTAPLQSLTNAKWEDVGGAPGTAGNGKWDATEAVYIAAGSTVAIGDIRLCCTNEATAPTANGYVSGGGTGVVQAGDGDIGVALSTSTRLKVTGPDGTFESTRSEYIYWSEDSFVTLGDRRVVGPGALAEGPASVVTAGNADANTWVTTTAGGSPLTTSTDAMYLSFDTCPGGVCFPFPKVNDIQLFGGTFGTRLTTSSTETVADLIAVPGPAGSRLLRNNRGDTSAINDDTFYLSFAAAGGPQVNDIRLTARDSSAAAGTFVKSGDTADLTATTTTSGTTFLAATRWVDNPGILTGYSADDFVIVDLPADVGGNAPGTFGRFDLRLSKNTVSGTTYLGGTMVELGDKDVQASSTLAAIPAPPAFFLRYFDANRNGVPNEGDIIYLKYADATVTALAQVPTLLDVRLGGPGGATSSVTPPAPPPPPPPPPTSNPATVAFSSPASGSFVMTGSTVQVSGTASGGTTSGVANSINSVTLTVNGTPATVSGTTSWTSSFAATTNGTYTLVATVTPSSGSPVSTQITVTANPTGVAPPAPPPPPTPPTTNQQLATLLTQNVALNNQLNQTLTQNSQLQSQISNLSTQISTQTQQVTALNSQLTALQQENAALKAQLGTGGNQTGGNGTPGFEPLLALAALGVAFLARRRRG